MLLPACLSTAAYQSHRAARRLEVRTSWYDAAVEEHIFYIDVKR